MHYHSLNYFEHVHHNLLAFVGSYVNNVAVVVKFANVSSCEPMLMCSGVKIKGLRHRSSGLFKMMVLRQREHTCQCLLNLEQSLISQWL